MHIIHMTDAGLKVPDEPIIPFIEGDGIGPDIWRAAFPVFEKAIKKAFRGKKRVQWQEVLAGEKAFKETGGPLPQDTMETFRRYLVGIKGPLATPVGEGIRSLNVFLRQELDLYVCLRPIRYIEGVPSPVKRPDLVDMIVFRENTEDVYAGFEFSHGSSEAIDLIRGLRNRYGWDIKTDSGIGLKPISRSNSRRLLKAAFDYAINHGRRSVTIVHKGNIQKFTEGAFRNWGFELAKEEYTDELIPYEECSGDPPKGKTVLKECMADIFFQKSLTRPDEFDVIATMNLNGDYISDALAAQVGGIGLAPGANINFETGRSIFEATHGTAPIYAGLNKANPTSLLLSGALLFDYIGWHKVARLIEDALKATFRKKTVTYDLARLMKGATEVSCSLFAELVCENMEVL
ncbi:MAG: NADP-dependent isocitrate dehydrogenase [Thermodesulfobacteriota bacterium]